MLSDWIRRAWGRVRKVMTPVMREVRIFIKRCTRKVTRAVEKVTKYAKEHPWKFWTAVVIGAVGITLIIFSPTAVFAATRRVLGKCLELF